VKMLWKTGAETAKSRLMYWDFTGLHRGCTDGQLVRSLQVPTSIMALTLTDVRRIASDVAQHEDPSLEVVGVMPREGSSTSAEVIFASRVCEREPCRMVIGVSRRLSEAECRGTVRKRLQERLGRS
jgi:hypothetical protein